MKRYLTLISLCLTTYSALAQVDKTSELYKIILSKDSLLFKVGFNHCNIKQFESLLSDSLKFYHDKNGVSDKKKFIEDVRNGLCKNPANFQARRELLPESTEIFALYNNGVLYGVIQEGVH